jgi:hypothetical protein
MDERGENYRIESQSGRIRAVTLPDHLLDLYYTLRPRNFGFLEVFALNQAVQAESAADLLLTVKLRSSLVIESACLDLQFKGVRNLRFQSSDGLVRLFVDITSIRERQMEKLNYSVAEIQERSFSFLCESFTARVVEM